MAPLSGLLTDGLLIFAAITVTISLFGGAFLFILRVPRFQFSLKFLLAAIGCIAIALGAWSAVLHSAARRSLQPNRILWDQVDPEPAPAQQVPSEVPGWNDLRDVPYDPKPLAPSKKPRAPSRGPR